MIVTLGFDIAAQTSKNGICAIEWPELKVGCRGHVKSLKVVKNESATIPQFIAWKQAVCDNLEPAGCGVDQPFKFPRIFQNALKTDIPPDTVNIHDYNNLNWRQTEQDIRSIKKPLSSVTSMMTGNIVNRCWRLLDALDRNWRNDLAGESTKIFEIYPAAFLTKLCKKCDFDGCGYYIQKDKHGKEKRVAGPKYKEIGDEIVRKHIFDNHLSYYIDSTPNTCESGDLECECVRCLIGKSDDALDAVVCAIVARLCLDPNEETKYLEKPNRSEWYKSEGIIHLPKKCPGEWLN